MGTNCCIAGTNVLGRTKVNLLIPWQSISGSERLTVLPYARLQVSNIWPVELLYPAYWAIGGPLKVEGQGQSRMAY